MKISKTVILSQIETLEKLYQFTDKIGYAQVIGRGKAMTRITIVIKEHFGSEHIYITSEQAQAVKGLNGRNVERLAVKGSADVQLFYNRIDNTYTLQILKFSISKASIIDNYKTFQKKYDILIKDKISQL